ncbi:hypothetical protein [Saccharopolyspora rhizosphaerae]|uniref:hypothetical protein n=1 Tax=Saccharopolyspora rhizosphaerae TaxID=2492662 RepID=UPI0018F27CBE|nr:hypothetical protein [Saccharopolyspora rhizosphaerae]
MTMNDVRPTLSDPEAQATAEAAVADFAAELQKGLDSSDADVYDRSSPRTSSGAAPTARPWTASRSSPPPTTA